MEPNDVPYLSLWTESYYLDAIQTLLSNNQRDARRALALGGLPALLHGATRRLGNLPADPFTLGVASGDPTPDSVVLWTRLAHDVLAEIGTAVIDVIEVGFEIADSPDFRNIVRRGAIATVPELGHCAHADIRGLAADTEYYYRWQVGNATSPVGRTKTAPAGSIDNQEFRFAFASCQQYEHGFYTAYQHMAEEEMDLIVHLGDYIYERSWGQNLVRHHEGAEIITCWMITAIATSPTRAILTSRQHTPLPLDSDLGRSRG